MRQTVSKAFVALVAILTVTSMAAMPAMAASNGLNYEDGQAPNPEFVVDQITVDEWDNGDFDSPTEYYDDSGDATSLDAEVNRSSDASDLGTGTVNPITLTATDIKIAEFGEFPRNDDEDGDNSASALDASEWTASGASMSDVSTAPNVDAVQYSGSASGDYATYSNFSITADAEKRYAQLAADITSASGTPVIKFEDADGDYVAIEVYNASANQSANNVLANATGEGHVSQVQLGKLTVQGSGDGVLGEVQSLNVTGDVTADFSLINAERTSPYTFGEKYVDTDDDDELETEDIMEPHGAYSVHSVDTLGSTFDDAVIMGLSFPAHVSAEMLPAEDVDATFKGDNAYPNWDSVADIHYRLSLPDAYDISYSGVSLEQTTEWPGTRYVSVEFKEGVGDTDFADIDNTQSLTSQYDAENKTVTLDSTISPGTEYFVGFELKLTGDEAAAMQAVSGGAGVMGGGSGGGIWSFITSPIGMLVSVVGAALGGRSLGVF